MALDVGNHPQCQNRFYLAQWHFPSLRKRIMVRILNLRSFSAAQIMDCTHDRDTTRQWPQQPLIRKASRRRRLTQRRVRANETVAQPTKAEVIAVSFPRICAYTAT